MFRRTLLLSVMFALGCAPGGLDLDRQSDAPSTFALSLSAADAARVLDLANYPGADEATLDGPVGLDHRAARDIHAHRAGADGAFPSSDDNYYDSIAELDAVPYVGNVAFQKLVAYAHEHPAPVAETVEGVLFRGWESEIVVWGVNGASIAELDGMLDVRAANSLVANRPFAKVAAMGPLGYVGVTALKRLRAEASTWWTQRAGGGTGGGHTPPDANCVFGLAYKDIFTLGGTVVLARRKLDPGSSTNATQRTQLVAAVKSVYEDVTTVTQAFEAVDQNEINHVEIWDASNRVQYTAYEFGAGDNSYGKVFAYGTTTVAATINDGDLYDCAAMWGDEMRPCELTQDCADGLTCHGTSAEVPTGRCIDLQAPSHPQEGNDCSQELGCLPQSGLVCAGAATTGTGNCVPAWMRGYFLSSYGDVDIPDGSATGVTLELPVYGLATVHTDVLIDLIIDHPRPADLRVTLTNPATAEVVLFDGPDGWPVSQLDRSGYVVPGFSGDEQANGIWRLKVEDLAGGSTGYVFRFGLGITSRWD